VRALTLWQPWAWAILHAGKRIENRTRPFPHKLLGQVVALHAGKTYSHGVWNWPLPGGPPTKEECVLGAVVGTARLVYVFDRIPATDVPEDQHKWWVGPVGWLLDDVHPLAEPVPCRGFQGFWTLPSAVEHAVRARMTFTTVTCPHCENSIDPETCYCGESRENHRGLQDEHPFVPMGCDCLRA
jgi:hypothetical protein